MLTSLKNLTYYERWLYRPWSEHPLCCSVLACGYRRVTSTAYDWHGRKHGSLPFALFQYTLSGRGELTYENTVHEVDPGTAMILHIPHNHRYRLPRDSSEWEFFYVGLYGPESMSVCERIETKAGPLLSLADDSGPLKTAAAIVRALADQQPERTDFELSLYAYRLLMKLGEYVFDNQHAAPRHPAVKAAIEYCNRSFGRPVSIDDMARLSNISRYHFSRLFTASEGIPPGEYLLKLRLHHAMELLRTTRLSCKEIAFRCGFNSAAYFCRYFKKAFDVTPGRFRGR